MPGTVAVPGALSFQVRLPELSITLASYLKQSNTSVFHLTSSLDLLSEEKMQ